MWRYHTNKQAALSLKELRELAALSEGYSGSDVVVCCTEATMQILRELESCEHFRLVTIGNLPFMQACANDDVGAIQVNPKEMPPEIMLPRKMRLDDLVRAVNQNAPTKDSKLCEEIDAFHGTFAEPKNSSKN
eukprot:TRINITY_DN6339_c0_g1_i1.p2 TRINITY_DN6339_c0_g1~~TRINITY_DN6339_c0_g1_i1.p2  ORF type:complete len:133 (-),score=23.17 TRINITY_DN6339_c0_g1_i1:121-519(-)